MRFAALLIASFAVLSYSSKASAPIGAASAGPIVIELYQSQGCSSCPPANAALNALASDPSVLALSFAVTYWDQLGWKDKFARPEFTQRQYDFAHVRGTDRVFTPQFVINGKDAGSDSAALRDLARRAGPARGGPSIAATWGAVRIGAGKTAAPTIVWLVNYDPRVRNIAIRAGENGGRTLPHRNIVTSLKALGSWTGAERRFSLPPKPEAGILSAIVVQRGKGGAIVAARKL